MAVAILVKGYPRLSETFIARELLGLQERGVDFTIVSLRHPTDTKVHDLHSQIAAPILYLPEYLYQEPRRVLRGLWSARKLPGFLGAFRMWLRDLFRDPTANRLRRFGQAAVLAAELPGDIHLLYIHYLHTPASVGRYTAAMRQLDFALSAHAKDVWTTPPAEIQDKLNEARWTVTCTRTNLDYLTSLSPDAPITLVYHGVDHQLFTRSRSHSTSDGTVASEPVRMLCVARAVPKKGLDVVLQALAALPSELSWRLDHVGGGPLRADLERLASRLGIHDRVSWHGSRSHTEVQALLDEADIFCLPARIAPDGDRDGLPNVLLEAMSMEVPVVSSSISAIPEIVEHRVNGLLVPPDNVAALSDAVMILARDPALRAALGRAGRRSALRHFSADAGYDLLAERLGSMAPRRDAA